MKKLLMGSGVVALVAGAALAPAAGASQPDGTACGGPSGQSSCTWTADASGEYGGATSGSWSVVQVTHDAQGNEVDVTVDSGNAGPFAGAPGTLTKGNTYRLTVNGAGG